MTSIPVIADGSEFGFPLRGEDIFGNLFPLFSQELFERHFVGVVRY